MLLYKYCDPGGLAILQTGRIRLSHPRAFNDPFDCSPHISKFDDVVLMADYNEARTKDIVVLSLADNCDSLLMWAHYTNQHKGFLIGLDGKGRIIEDGLVFRQFDAVSYSHHRPSAGGFKKLTAEALYFRKSSEWAYEREWRIVTSSLAEHAKPIDPEQMKWEFPLMPQSVRTVIVGFRAHALFPDIYRVLGEERYKHVSLHYAMPDIEEFKLNIKSWPRSRWGSGAPPELLGAATVDPKAASEGEAPHSA